MTSPLHSFDGELLRWLRQQPGWAHLPWAQRVQLGWRSYWASVNRRLSDRQHADAPVPAAPLFIAGPWRSGTTVMHELLHASLGWPTPLTWQCMNASAYQLIPAPTRSVALARPMDGLTITATSPQEDEFALLCLGVDSAYRGFLMPERLSTLEHTLDPAHWSATATTWMPRFERFLQGVTASAGKPGARLLLKSPNHSFRLPALSQRWPEAQVVWMARDPVAVFHSNRKMWRAMFDAHALRRGEDAEALDRFLAKALMRCAEVLEGLLDSPKGRLVVCRQEDLQARPASELDRVLAGLGLAGEKRPSALGSALAATAKGRVEDYGERPLPEPAAAAARQLQDVQDRAVKRQRC